MFCGYASGNDFNDSQSVKRWRYRIGGWLSGMCNRVFSRGREDNGYINSGIISVRCDRDVADGVFALGKEEDHALRSVFVFSIYNANGNLLTYFSNRWQRAAYTIEMSIILPLLLAIIAMLIYLGFYVNDRVVLEEAAKEAAMYSASSYPGDSDKMQSAAKGRFNEIIDKKLFAMGNVNVEIDRKGIYIVINVRGKFKIPMFAELRKELFGGELSIKARGRGIITQPVGSIQAAKLVENIVRGDD